VVGWTELRERLGRAPEPIVTGRHTSVQPRRGNGTGQPAGDPVRRAARFAHRPPYDWFIAYDGGEISLDSWEPGDGRRAEDFPAGLVFGPDFPWDLAPSPERLITGAAGAALAEATCLAGPEAVRHDGRDAWAVTLRTPSVPYPLRVVVDDRAGILLAAEVQEVGYREELTELDFPAELPDSRFEWSEALEAAEEARRQRRAEVVAHYAGRSLPVPSWWPGGLAHAETHVFDGDLGTGLLAIDLYDTDAPPDTPTMAVLIRQQPDTPYFEPGWVADPRTFAHRWQDGIWQWTLALWGRPLSPDELDRVVGSM
jgi:hypothetical protein